MKQKAIVKEIDGQYAMVEVSRSAMCDGCVKENCESHTCAAGAMFASAKTITARAKNPVGARVGDAVWVESADEKVLIYAALVFLLPIAACIFCWALTSRLVDTEWIAYLTAGMGFALSLVGIGLLEKKKKKDEPDIVITHIRQMEHE